MKILMLVPFLPIDQMSGGQTRWFHLIKLLSKKHQITLMSLIKDDSEKKYIPELENYCVKVMVFKRPKSPWTFRNLFLTLITFNPLVVIRNLSLEERKAIKKELDSNNYDLIHAETFYVMPHVPKTNIPIVLVEPTIEYSVYKHYVDNEVSAWFKPIYMFDVIKLRFWEKYYWRKADKLFAVSEDDKKVMQREIPGINVGVIPNGVDLEFFDAKKMSKKKPPRILYHGDYKWMQNVEAVNLLIKEVWPYIKSRLGNVKLWISGRNMPSMVIEMSKKDPDIIVSESLSDNRDIYKSATVLVTPIKGPGGTRLKVLEAMASALPVVSTPVGVAGLGIVAGQEALVGKDPVELASLTVKLLEDPEFAAKIGGQGRRFVAKNFDWKSIVTKLEEVYVETTTLNNNS